MQSLGDLGQLMNRTNSYWSVALAGLGRNDLADGPAVRLSPPGTLIEFLAVS